MHTNNIMRTEQVVFRCVCVRAKTVIERRQEYEEEGRGIHKKV